MILAISEEGAEDDNNVVEMALLFMLEGRVESPSLTLLSFFRRIFSANFDFFGNSLGFKDLFLLSSIDINVVATSGFEAFIIHEERQ